MDKIPKMVKMFGWVITFLIAFSTSSCAEKHGQSKDIKTNINTSETSENNPTDTIRPGAYQINEYLPLLQGKATGLVVNKSSRVAGTHLIDTLLSHGINVKKIYAPEHGLRGTASAGEAIEDDVDKKTGLPVISLYGSNKKPSPEQLEGIDVLVFDMQDVGVRFFTYISTMHYVMEAAAENNKQVIVLDRPNPNGHYIAGPVLDTAFSSFVGMHPIPVVHGLTVGELAKMIKGEGWINEADNLDLTVIPVENYTHNDRYSLPVRPSPNLPNDLSIALYPSLAFFEGTGIHNNPEHPAVSVGRGTDFPFQVIGYNDPAFGDFTFVPEDKEGAQNPPLEGDTVYGTDFRDQEPFPFTLRYVIDYYNKASDKENFFNNFFNLLAGTDELQKQIKAGLTEEQIRESWEEDLQEYRTMRKEYLLYPDFEK